MSLCIHEMELDSCADCRPRARVGRQGSSTTIRIFPARYYGRCAGCADRIEKDDHVGYLDDDVCCVACCTETGSRLVYGVTPTA